jgi:DNA-binding GntR family transcriptional regulator
MTATARPEPLTDIEIDKWAADPKPSYQVAAGIARAIRSGKLEPGAAIDSNQMLAGRHDCSRTAAGNGKALLVERGMLRKEGQFYVVAGIGS